MIIGPYQVAARWLRRHAFTRFEAPRIRAAAELLVHDAVTRRPAPLHGAGAAIVPLLESYARRTGWTVQRDSGGAATLHSPDGGRLRIGAGGQLIYSTRMHESPLTLHVDLDRTVRALAVHAEECGIVLVAAGIDPVNQLEAAPLLLESEYHSRMAAYFSAIGRAGARMMRQSAGLRIGVGAQSPGTAFTALNAVAPVLVAAFANSPWYAGGESGCASFRAEDRLRTDPARTGLIQEGPPHERYAEFALQAPAMMLPHTFNALPFVEHWRLGTNAAQWREHLGTLHPEVRPRGHLEVLSIDAQPPDALALPLLLVSAIAWDVQLQGQLRELVGPADPTLLARAARSGTRDTDLAATFASLSDMAFDAVHRIGGDRYGEVLERARDEIVARATAVDPENIRT